MRGLRKQNGQKQTRKELLRYQGKFLRQCFARSMNWASFTSRVRTRQASTIDEDAAFLRTSIVALFYSGHTITAGDGQVLHPRGRNHLSMRSFLVERKSACSFHHAGNEYAALSASLSRDGFAGRAVVRVLCQREFVTPAENEVRQESGQNDGVLAGLCHQCGSRTLAEQTVSGHPDGYITDL